MSPLTIGFLLPRSTDYPAISFDLLDGLKLNLQRLGMADAKVVTENIGFGEDADLNHAKAEKMIIDNDVQLVIAYANNYNAELLYPLAETCGRPFLFIDPSMDTSDVAPHPLCHYISLQGLHACYETGRMAAQNGKQALVATSFYDGGYRGPWSCVQGFQDNGGSVAGNFVSLFKTSEFTIQIYLDLLKQGQSDVVIANFCTYLNELFLAALKAEGEAAVALPFFCSPFMTEEQILNKIDFPGGTFHAFAPWASSVENEQNRLMIETIKKEKNKAANIFHLVGWEAAIVVARLFGNEPGKLNDFSYESPRGTVTFHPETNHTYAPLYKGMIVADENGKCRFDVQELHAVDAASHFEAFMRRPVGQVSRWKNNFLCI
jgi:branched-chain amino acid transport system substrate-binding protein